MISSLFVPSYSRYQLKLSTTVKMQLHIHALSCRSPSSIFKRTFNHTLPLKNVTRKFKIESIAIAESKSTGNGPFVDLPQLQTMNSGGLLRLQLPQASSLNLLSMSPVAVKGDVEQITTDIRSIGSEVQFQQVRTKAPATLVLADPSTCNSRFTLLTVKKDSSWTVFNSRSLAAWWGYDLLLATTENRSIMIEGEGTVVVKCNAFCQRIQLEEGSFIYADASCLVASNALIAEKVTLSTERNTYARSLRILVERLLASTNYLKRFWSSIKKKVSRELEKMPPSAYISRVSYALDSSKEHAERILGWLKARLGSKSAHLVKIVGPGDVIIGSK